QLTRERLSKLHHQHIGTGKRSVRREAAGLALPDESALLLAGCLVGSATGPLSELARAELCSRVQAALVQLNEGDREVLVMRYLEQLPTRDIAGVLGVSEGAIKMRHLRALERLRPLLEGITQRGE